MPIFTVYSIPQLYAMSRNSQYKLECLFSRFILFPNYTRLAEIANINWNAYFHSLFYSPLYAMSRNSQYKLECLFSNLYAVYIYTQIPIWKQSFQFRLAIYLKTGVHLLITLLPDTPNCPQLLDPVPHTLPSFFRAKL